MYFLDGRMLVRYDVFFTVKSILIETIDFYFKRRRHSVAPSSAVVPQESRLSLLPIAVFYQYDFLPFIICGL